MSLYYKNKNILRAQLREAVFLRDNYQCVRCWTVQELTIDHIVPLSRGGKNNKRNMQTLCRKCNQEKGNKLESELENDRKNTSTLRKA